MNKRMIAYVLGRIMLAEGLLMLPCVVVGLLYAELDTVCFLPAIALAIGAGVLLGTRRPDNTTIYAREGFFVVAAAWMILSIVGAIPFMLSDCFDSVWDCFFETVSGFTTTGASILTSPESLPRCILFWRSFSHWVGGMGVLVFVLAVMPMSEERSLHLMRAEVPGPVVGKLVPRMRTTALILYAVYTFLTVLLTVLLVLGDMPLFEAICHAFGTAGTGGFSVKNAGIAAYDSAYIDYVLGAFMLLFGINFNLYYLLLIRRVRDVLKSEELRCYLLIVAAAVGLITLNTYSQAKGLGVTVRQAFFQTASIITTTGYATVDFANLWPQFSQMIIVLLMLIGAMAGSTGGGLKISRVMLLCKSFTQEMRRLVHPRVVTVVRIDGKPVDKPMLHSTLVYFVIYIMIICTSTLALSLGGGDMTTNLTAELSCFNNIGPGLGEVGPMSNFCGFSWWAKVILSFNMLLGRLEIFPMMILFSPRSWRRSAV